MKSVMSSNTCNLIKTICIPFRKELISDIVFEQTTTYFQFCKLFYFVVIMNMVKMYQNLKNIIHTGVFFS